MGVNDNKIMRKPCFYSLRADSLRGSNKEHENMTTNEKIQLKRKELALTDDPAKSNKIQLKIRKLQLRLEIEAIQRKMEQLD